MSVSTPQGRPASSRPGRTIVCAKVPEESSGSTDGKLIRPSSRTMMKENTNKPEGSKLVPVDRSRMSYGGREVTDVQTKPLAPTPKSPATTPLPWITNQPTRSSSSKTPPVSLSAGDKYELQQKQTDVHQQVAFQSEIKVEEPASPSKPETTRDLMPRNPKMSLVQALHNPRPAPGRYHHVARVSENTAYTRGVSYHENADSTTTGKDDAASVASSTPRSTTSVGSQSSISSDAKWTTRGYSQSTGSTSSRKSSSTPPDADGKRKRSSRSMHIGFEGCSIDLECEHREHPGSWVLKNFSEIFKGHPDSEGINMCLKSYEIDKPTKLQAHSITAIVRGVQRSKAGKSCIMIQGPSGTGKTSAVSLAVLAILDPNIKHIQAIILSGSPLRDFDKFFTVFSTLQVSSDTNVLKSCFGNKDEGKQKPTNWTIQPGTQVLTGRSTNILHLLGLTQVCLEHVRVLVIDDAQTLAEFSDDPSDTPLNDVIQVCNILECQGAPTSKLTLVILSRCGEGHISRKVIRLLKSSVLKKKNLLSVQDMPTKLRMHVKHYYVQAPRQEWTRILSGLVKSLMFPRVIVFCDDRRHGIEYFPNKMRQMNLEVSVNLGSGEESDEIRRIALQDFSGGKTQFLFTTSEPATCQIVLPKVSCVFHLDVPSDMLSVYAVRLLPLDSHGRSDAVSVVFVEGSGPNPKIVEIEKLFGIRFMDMPFEFIPTNQ